LWTGVIFAATRFAFTPYFYGEKDSWRLQLFTHESFLPMMNIVNAAIGRAEMTPHLLGGSYLPQLFEYLVRIAVQIAFASFSIAFGGVTD